MSRSLGGGSDVPWGVRVGAATLSGIAYAATFAAVGVWVFQVAIERAGGGASALPLRSLATRAAVLGAVTLVAAVPFRIARVGGGLDALSDNDVLTSELKGPIGQAVALTAVALVAFAIAVDRRAPRWVTAAIGLAALGGFALEGHTRAMHLRWAMMSSDVVHLAAGAVWLGGIVGLVVAFRRRVEAVSLATLVRRFSDAALIAVAVVTVTGVLMAWIVLPTAGELTSTGYGLALIVKVALVALVVIALGGFNRFLLVPLVVVDRRRVSRGATPAAFAGRHRRARAVDRGRRHDGRARHPLARRQLRGRAGCRSGRGRRPRCRRRSRRSRCPTAGPSSSASARRSPDRTRST